MNGTENEADLLELQRRYHDECLRVGFAADHPADCGEMPGVSIADLLHKPYPEFADTMRRNLLLMAPIPGGAMRGEIAAARARAGV